jgi:fatty acid desaturase
VDRVYVHRPTARALVIEWLVCAVTIGLALLTWSPLAVLVAWGVLATRQHALFILYHDGVHGLIARPRRLNDAIINLAGGVPLLVPVHLYRSLHLVHHRELGREGDPERVLLYAGQDWDYRPLPMARLIRQFVFDLLLVNTLVMVARYVQVRATGRLKLPKGQVWPELFAMQALFAVGWVGLIALSPALAGQLALLWFVPLFTLTQAIQKVRSFAEHAPLDAERLSYSWAPGLFGRLVLWPYHIGLHHEHHLRPNLPWDALPGAFPDLPRRPGRTLSALLWSGRWT